MGEQPAACDTAAAVDPFLLSILRCPDCLSGLLSGAPGAPELTCSQCGLSHPVATPGIPVVWPSLAKNDGIFHHQQHWDELPKDYYEEIIRQNEPFIAALDHVEVPHCRGAVLEIG